MKKFIIGFALVSVICSCQIGAMDSDDLNKQSHNLNGTKQKRKKLSKSLSRNLSSGNLRPYLESEKNSERLSELAFNSSETGTGEQGPDSSGLELARLFVANVHNRSKSLDSPRKNSILGRENDSKCDDKQAMSSSDSD